MDDRDHESIELPAGEGSHGEQRRGKDRRADGGGLFGGYQGPERRSGQDRRARA